MKERGVTLIALIVTIVVLLILAGISIATFSGDSGIINMAMNAKEEKRAETINDRVELWKYESAMMDQSSEEYTTRDEMMWDLYKEGLLTKLELNLGKYKQKIKIASQTIDFGEDDAVRKIKVMDNPPIVECIRIIYRST